jgi:hypothetical protein
MKATFRTRSNRLSFEVNAETAVELFGQIADLQEVFDAESKCGICGSADLSYHHRVAQSFEFFELHCICGARFAFGQNKGADKGNLFPKRRAKSASGRYEDLPNGGWSMYTGRQADPDEGNYEPEPTPPPPQQRQTAPQGPPGPPAAQVPPPPRNAPPPAGNRHSADDLPYDQQAPPPRYRR